ncbi:dihydropteroate synthase [Amycolatopsis sp. CA-230715]|uniref:dihydropteroate synthase n=1 Tax=Amycolatopsis sp. CA-230715 TaxID=2745196 RepID=UPI001C012B71|nr:dihydropteroate synthase [Amycolatopsis sp. CA-230715]
MGVVNVTADSFADRGRFLAPTAALTHAHRLLAAGADVVELGPRPVILAPSR